MPLDPSIPLSVQPFPVPNRLAQLTGLADLEARRAQAEEARQRAADAPMLRQIQQQELMLRQQRIAQEQAAATRAQQIQEAEAALFAESIDPATGQPDMQKLIAGMWKVHPPRAFELQKLYQESQPTPPGAQPMMNIGGGRVFDPNTRELVYEAPPESQVRPPEPGSFRDYLESDAQRRKEIETARRAYGQADDAARRPVVPVVIQTSEGPQLVDRGSAMARPVIGPDGQPVKPAPTAQQREKAAGRQTAQPVLDSIAELSERINTQQGVIAKISGAAEKAKAQANLSDDVAEYQALVQMFTPMLARMVGHVGVLTEQDVQSVRAGLPQPGDSKSMRDRKMARIQSIINAQGGGGQPQDTQNAPAGPAPAAGGGLTYQDYLRSRGR